MLLRESLSSDKGPFAKLIRRGHPDPREAAVSPHANSEKDRPYRMNRKLSPDDLKELCSLYETGFSMVQLAEKFECHRQTIARQLKKAGVDLREQQLRTPAFDRHARRLYEQGNSLDEVANMLGVQASTINRAVRAAGGVLRLQRRRSWDN